MTAVRKVALVGLPGSGKSTVAPRLAKRLGWRCVDLDDEAERSAGRSLQEVFAVQGEAAFRQLEMHTLEEAVRADEPVVLACGGGLLTQPAARTLLFEQACVVCLDAPDRLLLQRISASAVRPLLQQSPADALRGLRTERAASYAAAHLHVPAHAAPDRVADSIAALLQDSVRVATATGAYHVEVRPGALQQVHLHIPGDASTVVIVSDRAVAAVVRAVAASLRREGLRVKVVGLKGGETVKTWRTAGRLLTRLAEIGAGRHDCVLALGGGTVGDLAGFAAATYMRGIAWIGAPTTLLGMVDSAVGGKTGINLPSGKNLAGAFWQPRAVVCDPDVLRTLPERAFRAAFAELVKYTMILPSQLDELLSGDPSPLLARDPETLAGAIRAACALKAAVVSRDEREAGERAILNYGHTVGHALEAAAGFGSGLNHGEAVAVGMRVAGRLSVRMLQCPAADIDAQDELLRRFRLGDVAPTSRGHVLEMLRRDKKRTGEGIGWVLLARRHEARVGQLVPAAEVSAALGEVLAA